MSTHAPGWQVLGLGGLRHDFPSFCPTAAEIAEAKLIVASHEPGSEEPAVRVLSAANRVTGGPLGLREVETLRVTLLPLTDDPRLVMTSVTPSSSIDGR